VFTALVVSVSPETRQFIQPERPVSRILTPGMLHSILNSSRFNSRSMIIWIMNITVFCLHNQTLMLKAKKHLRNVGKFLPDYTSKHARRAFILVALKTLNLI
jgi:hypothetical protein